MTTITGYHGTGTDFEGTPSIRTDINGLAGIFLTESETDAWYFAGMSTEGSDDGMERVFTATINMNGAEDLSEMEDQDEIISAALASPAPVIILPDLSGVSDREILVVNTSAIQWN